MSKLFTRLTLSYIAISVLIVAIVCVFANFMIENTFKNYISDLQEKKVSYLLSELTESFEPSIMGWNKDVLDKIGKNALENSLIVKIRDVKGEEVWNGWNYNRGETAELIKNMADNVYKKFSDIKGEYLEHTFKIKIKELVLGEIDIGYYGIYYYSEKNLELVQRLNIMFYLISALCLFIALIVGLLMSKEIAKPVLKVTEIAKNISKNNYKDPVKFNSDIVEISDLLSSINDLSETLANNRLLRKRVTTDIAHELRTPLSILQSHLEAIIEGIWQPDKKRLQSCYEEVIRLSGLVDNLKKIDDFDTGNITLDVKEFSVSNLLASIYLNFEADFRKKEIDFVLNNEKDIIVSMDKDKLWQVIMNIVSNALKYTKNKGKVSISLHQKHEEEVIIIIEDNGIGIDKNDLPFIFERLYRTDLSRAKATGGLGIGLTIAKYLIFLLKGRITVESEADKGSKFTIWLPVNYKC